MTPALREDLIQQRDRLQVLADRQASELEVLQVERTARFVAADQERERTAAHVRAVEDRAHQEVDRARRETQQWQQRLEATERSHRDVIRTLEARSETSLKQLQKAEKELARLSGQIVTLESSLATKAAAPRTKRTSRLTKAPKAAKVKAPKPRAKP